MCLGPQRRPRLRLPGCRLLCHFPISDFTHQPSRAGRCSHLPGEEVAAQSGCPKGQPTWPDFPNSSLALQDRPAGGARSEGSVVALGWGGGQARRAALLPMRASEQTSEPHQRPPLRMQVSSRSCKGRRGGPSPAQTGPAGPTAALLSLGAAMGYRRKGLPRFLGSNSGRTRKTKRRPMEWGRQEVPGT